MSNKDENLKLERIIHSFEDNISLKDINTLRAYKSIPVMPLDKIKTIANMLFFICTMMVDETRLRVSINELRKNEAHIHVDKEYINTYTQIISNQYFDLTWEKQNANLLNPAFDYIRENLEGDLSIKKVASICNISQSYFSKLFSKENLGSYSDYINKMKIEHAKRILFSTNMPINEIALKLRYSDCGYFIKVFKKFEGVTPAIYRALKTKA